MNLLHSYLHWLQSPCNPTMDNLIAAARVYAHDEAWIEGRPTKQTSGMSVSINFRLLDMLDAFTPTDYYRYTRQQAALNSLNRLTVASFMPDEG